MAQSRKKDHLKNNGKGKYILLNKQYLKITNNIIQVFQFKVKNPQFPITIGDWAIKLMLKRAVNNKSKL